MFDMYQLINLRELCVCVFTAERELCEAMSAELHGEICKI